jgi:hypothetical protein
VFSGTPPHTEVIWKKNNQIGKKKMREMGKEKKGKERKKKGKVEGKMLKSIHKG